MTLLRPLRAATLGIALLLGLPAGSALAQEAPAATAPMDGYERLFTVVTADPDNLTARRLAQITVDLILREEPMLASFEEEQPGFLAALGKAFQPIFISFTERAQQVHAPAFLAEVRSTITEGDAVAIARFYESPLGARLMRTARRSQMIEMSSEQLWSDDAFTEADTERDMAATSEATLEALSQDDLEAVEQFMRDNPRVLAGIVRIRPAIVTYRTAMDNEPFTPEEDAELEAVIDEVFTSYGF